MSFRFWQRWLQGVSAASALFGLLFLFAPGSRPLTGYNQQVVAAFHGAAAPAAALAQQRWAVAVLGSAMLGWGILLLAVASGPFGRREPWAWRSIAVSVVAWAAGDSIVSYRAGIPLEVLWNSIVVVAVALPLAMTYRMVILDAESERGAAAGERRVAGPSAR